MNLRTARLCLDCEEIHDAQRCPACASETFAYLSRWVAAPERRSRPRTPVPEPTTDPERLEAVRSLATGRAVTSGVVGITTLGLIGWFFRRKLWPPDARDRTDASVADRSDSGSNE
jgi:hypothetical protein